MSHASENITVTRRRRFGIPENEGDPWVCSSGPEVARVWELQRSHLVTGKPPADISEQLGCLAPPQVIMTSVSSVSISEAIWPLPTPQNSQEQVRLWDVYLIQQAMRLNEIDLPFYFQYKFNQNLP